MNFDPNPLPNPADRYLEEIQNNPFTNQLNFSDDTTHTFDINDFQEIELIGAGNHVVKKCVHLPSKKEVAIKYIHIPYNRYHDDEGLDKLKKLAREIQHFREIRNTPNILQFYGHTQHAGQILLCMELMDMSLLDLYQIVHKGKHLFPEEILGYITADILDALVACKEKELIHRDIKPENILVNKNGCIKVGDFGETRILHNSMSSSLSGTYAYRPPEHFQLENNGCDVRSDIWSLGIVLVELVLGHIPYKSARVGSKKPNITLLLNEISNINGAELVDTTFKSKSFSDDIREFVGLCLKDIELRPKYIGLKKTVFYQSYGSKSNEERDKIIATWLKTIMSNP